MRGGGNQQFKQGKKKNKKEMKQTAGRKLDQKFF